MEKRIETLDTLRAFAFIFVFINHACSNLLCANALGCFAVSIFLVLSGFVNTITYVNKHFDVSIKNNFRFMCKKNKRLFLLNAILTVLMILPDFIGDNINVSFFTFIKLKLNILMLQSWFPIQNININGPSWFFSVMLIFYLVFPCIIEKMQKKYSIEKAYKNILLSIILMFIIDIIGKHMPSFPYTDNGLTYDMIKYFNYFLPPVRLLEILIGCNIGYIYTHENESNIIIKDVKKNKLLEIVCVITCVLSVCIFCYFDSKGIKHVVNRYMWFCYTLLFICPSILLVICSAYSNNSIMNKFTNKYIILISKVSPYSFIIHTFVIDVLNRFFYRFFQSFNPIFYYNYIYLLRVIIGFPITILLSYFCMKCYNRKIKRNNL